METYIDIAKQQALEALIEAVRCNKVRPDGVDDKAWDIAMAIAYSQGWRPKEEAQDVRVVKRYVRGIFDPCVPVYED